MTPTHWVVLMLSFTALQYTITAGAYQFGSRPGMMVVFVGYAIANCGFIWDALAHG